MEARLGGFYLFYFAFLGALVPYWSLYLQSFGFGPELIGLLMGMLHLTRILAPSLWGWLADISGRRMRIVRLGGLCAWLCFGLIFWAERPLEIALVTLGFSFFWNAVLPQFEVVTLRHLGARKHRYSRIRVWGSVGFVASVLGVGWLLEWTRIGVLAPVLLVLLVLIWLNALLVADRVETEEGRGHQPRQLRAILCSGQVIAFFAVCFLVQFSHGPYYSFFSPMMETLGYGRGVIGLFWALGVVAEIALFVWMPSLLARFSYRQVMLVSLWLSALRWLITALLPEYALAVAFAQLLHAASFGGMHIVGIALVQHYFTPATQGRGQALFSSLGFGAGGFLGSVAARADLATGGWIGGFFALRGGLRYRNFADISLDSSGKSAAKCALMLFVGGPPVL